MIAKTLELPYYAVIFTSIRSDVENEYQEMAELMSRLAQEQEGYLGMESARNEIGITVSYWKDLDSIKDWKQQTDHQVAQQLGKADWYKSYKVRIAKVEMDYGFNL